MLFNSFGFIFIFLPICLVIYFFLNHNRFTLAAKAWLVFSSLFFYGWWNIKYLALIIASIIFNFSVGTTLNKTLVNEKKQKIQRKSLMIFGVIVNLLLLGYYKYTNFFLDNINTLFSCHIHFLKLILPLGISFFTFTQIAYLVDAYKEEVNEVDFLNYSLFVTFFPHLIAGPILHHSEMMPQFKHLKTKVFSYKNLFFGLGIFIFGLFKKVAIADQLAKFANDGFAAQYLTFLEAWITSLSYTFQLYFDFSGYTDMAIGIALMFNIVLPQNFNNPYISQNIKEFWRRWHITLSRFLRDYVYIPLGGNRISKNRTLVNVFITFLLGGLWHGAAWTFVIWGGLHGIAILIFNLWGRLNIKMNKFVAWFLTFNFINIAWVFFRAKDLNETLKILKGMFLLSGFELPRFRHFDFYFKNTQLTSYYYQDTILLIFFLSFLAIFLFKNIDDIKNILKPTPLTLFVYLGLTIFLIVLMIVSTQTPFLYFNF